MSRAPAPLSSSSSGARRRRHPHPDFDPPSRGSVAGRSSSITAAFFQAIAPVALPSEAEVDQALAVLGMRRGACVCAYCGGERTEWDHFRPTVVARRPTGYITELANLVPACGKCNQSKGNQPWRQWMLASPRHAPVRESPGFAERLSRLEAYEAWREPVRLDYAALIGQDEWTHYLETMDAIVARLREAETLARRLRAQAEAALAPETAPRALP